MAKPASLRLDTAFEPRHGEAVPVAPDIVRITAPNASPFTFHGTNSYLLGTERLVLVDPGPDDPRHLAALEAAVAGRPVEAILLTHTHRDHTGLARELRRRLGAPLLFEGPHRPARALDADETGVLDAAGDTDLVPDGLLRDGDVLALPDLSLRAVATPGHCVNHLAFAVEAGPAAGVLLSGDHVMAWSTTIVAPPDGAMADYMASLDRLAARADRTFLPGHGGPVRRPKPFLRALKAHRRMRERAILERIRAGDATIPAIVGEIYRGTDARLHGAAGLSVLAHLEDLVARGAVRCEGPPRLSSRYAPG